MDIHFFRVGYWNFISFLWCRHLCLILCDLYDLVFVSVHAFEGAGTSSILYRLFLAGKGLLLLGPWMDKPASKLQLGRAKARL